MSAPQLVNKTPRFEHWNFLDAVTGVDVGDWIETAEFAEGSITITIAVTGTVHVCASDAETKPAAATNGNQVGADITATATYSCDHLPRWLKIRASAAGGQIDALGTFRRAS
jgi:hypothetical protein